MLETNWNIYSPARLVLASAAAPTVALVTAQLHVRVYPSRAHTAAVARTRSGRDSACARPITVALARLQLRMCLQFVRNGVAKSTSG